MGFFFQTYTGEAVGVSVEVLNDSAHAVIPKFYLCEKQTFVAESKRKVHTNDILFGTGEPVPAETSQTTTKVLCIPPQLPPTFFNCCMMKLEYRLKVQTVFKDSIMIWPYTRLHYRIIPYFKMKQCNTETISQMRSEVFWDTFAQR